MASSDEISPTFKDIFWTIHQLRGTHITQCRYHQTWKCRAAIFQKRNIYHEWLLKSGSPYRRRNQRLTVFHKIVNGLVAIPADLHYNPRPTKNRNWKKIILKPKHNTDIVKNSFFPRTISDWNTLADNIVTCEKLNSFKQAVIMTKF